MNSRFILLGFCTFYNIRISIIEKVLKSKSIGGRKIIMIEDPFECFSKRKSTPFRNLLYDYEQWKKSDECLFASFTPSKSELPEYVIDFVLKTYQNSDRFMKHIYTYKTNNDIRVSSLDFYNLAIGFKKAARETAEYMVKNSSIGDLDTLFFAMVYLYRQSIELLLKASIFQIVEEREEQKTVLKKCAHDLVKLYEKFGLISTDSKLSESQHAWLHGFLKNISEFDRASDSFRYPFRINRNVLFNYYNFEHVFKERRDICLIKLVNKLEIAFALIIEDLTIKDEDIKDEELEDIREYRNFSTEFLEEGTEYYAKSVVGYDYNRSEIKMYANAYREVAAHLFSLTLNDSTNEHSNYYFAPIAYLYQNAIELAMKDLCLIACPNKVALKTIRSEKHNINAIWKVIKDNFHGQVSADIPVNHQSEIEKMINIFEEAKVNTSTFRYPCDKQLNRNFKNGHKLHVGYVYCVLNRYFNPLIDLCYLADEQIDALSEMNSHY